MVFVFKTPEILELISFLYHYYHSYYLREFTPDISLERLRYNFLTEGFDIVSRKLQLILFIFFQKILSWNLLLLLTAQADFLSASQTPQHKWTHLVYVGSCCLFFCKKFSVMTNIFCITNNLKHVWIYKKFIIILKFFLAWYTETQTLKNILAILKNSIHFKITVVFVSFIVFSLIK